LGALSLLFGFIEAISEGGLWLLGRVGAILAVNWTVLVDGLCSSSTIRLSQPTLGPAIDQLSTLLRQLLCLPLPRPPRLILTHVLDRVPGQLQPVVGEGPPMAGVDRGVDVTGSGLVVDVGIFLLTRSLLRGDLVVGSRGDWRCLHIFSSERLSDLCLVIKSKIDRLNLLLSSIDTQCRNNMLDQFFFASLL